jgi:hypothetical protein
MQTVPTLELNSWADFKTTCLSGKKLLIQYIEEIDFYDIYANDSLVWHIKVDKGTAEATDFENNYKADANQRANLAVVLVDREGTEIALPVGETAPLSAALIGGIDDSGNVQVLSFDGSELETTGKSKNVAGTEINPATEDTLATLATETKLEAVRALLASLDGKDYATQTTLAALLVDTGQIETLLTTIDGVLDSIKDTDGIKKITDPLPAGTNNIGKIVLTDGTYDVDVSSSGRLAVAISTDAKGVVNEYLEYSGSIDMATTPTKQFVWNPGSTHDVEGASLVFVIEDATIRFGDKFGGISALSNGVLVEVKASDASYTLANVQRTREFLQLADSGGFEVYSATPDALKASLSLEGFVFRKSGTYANPDYVRVTIQDNLGGLSFMSALFKGREV